MRRLFYILVKTTWIPRLSPPVEVQVTTANEQNNQIRPDERGKDTLSSVSTNQNRD